MWLVNYPLPDADLIRCSKRFFVDLAGDQHSEKHGVGAYLSGYDFRIGQLSKIGQTLLEQCKIVGATRSCPVAVDYRPVWGMVMLMLYVCVFLQLCSTDIYRPKITKHIDTMIAATPDDRYKT